MMRQLMEKFQGALMRTRQMMQLSMADNAVRRASEKEVLADLRLLQMDNEIRRIDEALERIKSQGALID